TLGFHPHYCMKVALPIASLESVAALDFVRWVGMPSAQQKIHPRLLSEFAQLPQGDPLEVYVDVYESDLCSDSTSTRVDAQQAGAPNHGRDFDAGAPLGGERW